MLGHHESGFIVTGTSSFPQYWFIPGESSPVFGPPLSHGSMSSDVGLHDAPLSVAQATADDSP